MIIYGIKTFPLKSDLLPNETCSNCGTKGKIVLSIFSKYIHIFWIPTFPIGRTGVSTCMNCQQTLVSKDMPMFLKMQYEQNVPQTRIPLWTWSGLGVIAVLVAVLFFSNSRTKEIEQVYIKEPVEGDIYRYETEDGAYSLMKVVGVSADSVLLQYNEFETDKKSGDYKLLEKPFVDVTYQVSRSHIEGMYSSGKIYAIDRK